MKQIQEHTTSEQAVGPAGNSPVAPLYGLAWWVAYAAAGWAFLFAAVNFYWAAGGTVGAQTIGPAITRPVAAGDPAWIAALWGTGLLKVVAGLLALAFVCSWGRRVPRPALVAAAWLAGLVMAGYEGIASLIDHLLMATGVIGTPLGLGSTALHWHLALQDPWWLLGGVLFGVLAHTVQSGRTMSNHHADQSRPYARRTR